MIGCVNQILSVMPKPAADVPIGLYTGLPGIGYVLTEVGTVLNDETLIQRGVDIFAACSEHFDTDKEMDIIGGSAGLIPASIAISQRYDVPSLLE